MHKRFFALLLLLSLHAYVVYTAIPNNPEALQSASGSGISRSKSRPIAERMRQRAAKLQRILYEQAVNQAAYEKFQQDTFPYMYW